MIEKKDKLLNKLVKKDYNNLVEELLATKEFDETAKSLILSMSYKIETAYKDYEKVKKNVLSKNEYMKNLFLTLQKECENITIIKQTNEDKSNKKSDLDRENKKIKCYPIERKLLYCLSDIGKKDNILKCNNSIIKDALTKLLNDGNCINTCEPLRDFNGFSWNILVRDIENLTYNLVYQDLIIISGNDFLEEWINRNKFVIDYWEGLKNKIDENFSKDLREKILTNIIKIAMLQSVILDKNFKEIAENERLQILNEFNRFKNSEKYLVDLAEEKKELNKKIKEIDQIINDKDLLYTEYEKRNEQLPLEKKIFSMRVLKQILRNERELMLKKIEEYGYLMNPQIFLQKSKEVTKKFEYFSILECKDFKRELLKYLINLQKNVLEIFRIKIDKSEEKQEIIELIYELRYYYQIPVTEEQRIYQVEALRPNLEEVENLLIKKAIDKKVLIEISDNEKINSNVIRNIFISKILDLQSIGIKLYNENETWKAQFLDEDILENTIQIEENIEKNNLKIKTKKLVKLFI